MRSVNIKTLQESIEYYGKDKQSIVCMEECAELIQCISKELRGKSDIEHITEEIADVCICIELLKRIYQITDDQLQVWMDFKINRMSERMHSSAGKQ